MITVIAFIIILSILIFVHELGHFIVAKRSGITVEEFAIGFPPRAVKVWQDEGKITLDGHEYVISRRVKVPRTVQPGVKVTADTGVDGKGRPIVTRLKVVDSNHEPKEAKQTRGSEAKFFDLLGFLTRKSAQSTETSTAPTVTVEAVNRPTEYSVNWIPLGGYVRMVGEEDPTDPGSCPPETLTATGLSESWWGAKNYTVNVPGCYSTLTITTSVGNGALDLFVNEDGPSSSSAWDCRQTNSGTNKSCTLSDAGGKLWGIQLKAKGFFGYFNGVTLRATYQ